MAASAGATRLAAKRTFWAALLIATLAVSVQRWRRVQALERAVHDSAEEFKILSQAAARAENLERRIWVIKAYAQVERNLAASRRACPGFFSLLQKTMGTGRLELETLDMKMVGAALHVSATARSQRESDLSEWRRALGAVDAQDDNGELREVAVTSAAVSNGAFRETVSMKYFWKGG